MKRIIGFLVLGGAVATLVAKRVVQQRKAAAQHDEHARSLEALRARLERIPMAARTVGVH